MNYQGCYRCLNCPMRRQEVEYNTRGQMGYLPGVQMGDTAGYAPGMQAGQPEYGMEMQPQPEYGREMRPQPQPEYGAWPDRMQSERNQTMPQTPWYGALPQMPYYQMPGYPQTLWQEMESERDMQKLKEMYPDAAKEVLPYVEEECDKMEYDGSVMFDEYPDRVMMGRIRNNIYDRVKDRYELPEEEDKDEILAMNRETRRRYPPRKNWLGDMIDVLLFQEMHRRRCRHRNCRGWR